MKAKLILALLFASFMGATLLDSQCMSEEVDLTKKVQVFVLAGQSNMEGKGSLHVLDCRIESDDRKDVFGHLKEGGKKDGEWIERKDVWVSFVNKRGYHSVGYGHKIGTELEFGNVIGDHFDAPVLLIKTAYGGAALARKYRPPSSGLPAKQIQAELERVRKKKPEATEDEIKANYGAYYRRMLADVDDVTKNMKEYFPDYQGQGYEIAGFVWFQGFNDRINKDYSAEYQENLANLIRDVRKDLKTPKLPVIVGQVGFGGSDEDRERLGKKPNRPDLVKEAQAAISTMPEFSENAKTVKTDLYWDWKADAVFSKGWRENLEEWKTVGGDRPYHYLGSPYFYCNAGKAFGNGMLELLGAK